MKPAAIDGGKHDSGTAVRDNLAHENTVLDAALHYARLGYGVFPCRPNTKVPATVHGFKDAVTDPAQVRKHLAGSVNLGLIPPAGVLVVDLDVPEEPKPAEMSDDEHKAKAAETETERRAVALRRFETMRDTFPELGAMVATTPSGGFHMYVRLPDDAPHLATGPWPKGDPEPWGELRGLDRAYLVASPSTIDGVGYEWLTPPRAIDELEVATPALFAFVVPPQPEPSRNGSTRRHSSPSSGTTAYGRKAIEAEADDLASMRPNTGRNHRLNVAAFNLAQLVAGGEIATRGEVEDALTDAAHACGLDVDPNCGPRGIQNTIASGLSAGMQKPRTAPERPPTGRENSGRNGSTGSDDRPESVLQPEGRDEIVMTPELARRLASFKDTDLGNGERLAYLFGDRMRWCPTIGWLVWDGRRWTEDSSEMVYRYVARMIRSLYAAAAMIEDDDRRTSLAKHAVKSERGRGMALALERAYRGQEVRDLVVHADQLDADPDLLNVGNGTVHLPTGKLRPHDPADLITKLAPAEYDPVALAPTWRAFQERISDGDEDLIAFKRRAYGYTATGHNREQALLIAHGTGANGKSTELEVIAEALGDYATTAAFDTFANARDDKTRRNGLARLMGARYVRAVESDAGVRLSEGTVKTVTGGEAIVAERKGRDPFEYRPHFTLWLASNHKPQTRGTDHGLWRRIRLVPYAVTIPEAERDARLPEHLTNELPGILAWIVAGAREWYQDGLGTTAAVDQATDAYRADMDSLRDFLQAAVEVEDEAREGSARLHAAYRGWCAESGDRTMSTVAFAAAMEERGHKKRRTKSGVVWDGIRLSDTGDDLADRTLNQDGGRFY